MSLRLNRVEFIVILTTKSPTKNPCSIYGKNASRSCFEETTACIEVGGFTEIVAKLESDNVTCKSSFA
jgi:hypothetical protein